MQAVDHDALEDTHKRLLEGEIIELLAEKCGVSLGAAMDAFYSSKLAEEITAGAYGIQYLDARYLVEDLLENENVAFAVN
jgi:hypothetical protein